MLEIHNIKTHPIWFARLRPLIGVGLPLVVATAMTRGAPIPALRLARAFGMFPERRHESNALPMATSNEGVPTTSLATGKNLTHAPSHFLLARRNSADESKVFYP
jgi:hypothetical protein